MFKTTILSLLLLQAINSQCGKGCLRCTVKSSTDSAKMCQLCDTVSSYYMQTDGTCALSDLKNCIMIQHDNTCGFCNTGYYIDKGKCVAIDVQKKIENCEYYDTNQNCTDCLEGFLMATSSATISCTKIASPLANCMNHLSATVCKECSTNFYLAEDKTCKALPTDCLGYSQTQCNSCQSGYLMNINKYRKEFVKMDSKDSRQVWWIFLQQVKNNFRISLPLDLCERTTAEFCATFDSFEQCATCQQGYYLESSTKKCTLFPEPIIQNCMVYQFLSAVKWQYRCTKCNNLFRRQDDKTCVAINILDCIENDSTLNTDTCRRCKAGKKLVNNNCTSDQPVIDGCSIYEASTDKCLTCNSGRVLSSEGLSCKNALANCSVHQSFQSSATTITCQTCNMGHFRNTDGSACTRGSLNCDVYTNETTCSQCTNQFFENPTCATKHPDINSCLVYSRSVNNTCLSCPAMHVPFLMTEKCLTFNPLTGCSQHKPVTVGVNNQVTIQCNTCSKGFVINAQFTCDAVSTKTGFVSGCIDLGNNKCIECESGKFLSLNSSITGNDLKETCRGNADWAQSNCSSQNTTSQWTDQECDVCNAGFYPISSLFCASRNELNFLSTTNPATIQNLDRCDQVDSSLGCTRCKNNFYITSGVCNQTCTNSIRYVNQVTVNTRPTIINNTCDTAATLLVGSDTNASLIGSNNSGTVIQYACKNAFYTVRNQTATGINLNPWKTDLTSSEPVVFSIADKNQGVTCPTFASGVRSNGVVLTAAPQNIPVGKDRQIWHTKQVDVSPNETPDLKTAYLTVACGWQKAGTIDGTGNEVFITCESVNSNQFNSTRFGGVPLHWQNLFNAHECVNSSPDIKIPVVAFEADNNTDYNFLTHKKYGFDNDNVFTPTVFEKPLICLNIKDAASIRTQLNLPTNNANVNAMANCGLGFLNLKNYTSRLTFNNIGYDEVTATVGRDTREHLACVACKPGFKPDANKTGNNDKFVRGCTAIQFCETTNQTIFNACSKCIVNYTWASDANGNIEYDRCVPIPTTLTNCLAYNNTSQTTPFNGSCTVCNKGFNLDKDGRCVQATVPNCTDFQGLNVNYNAQVKNFLYDQGADCKVCSSTHIVWGGFERNVCVRFPTLADSADKNLGTFVVTTSQVRDGNNFIDRCQKYNKNLKCAECHTNYILTQDQLLCKPKINEANNWKLAFCTTANNNANDKTCLRCDDGYSLTSNGCEKGSITQCTKYETSVVKTQVTCTECGSGYWLKSLNSVTTCEKGKIPFCTVYINENTCSQCQTDYWLFSTTGSTNGKYCFPKHTPSACRNVTFTTSSDTTPGMAYNYLQAQCNDCDGTYSYKVIERQSKCAAISYPPTNSCKTISTSYDLNVIGGLVLQCTECNNGFYLSSVDNNYVCLARNPLKNVNCEVFQIDQDKCAQCKANFYLNALSDGCIAYPTGNYACTAYDNSRNCTACDFDHYLSSNACIKVVTKVNNCQNYSADNKCSMCNSNFFLTSDILCEAVTTSLNCATFESKDSCKTCNLNFKLVTANGKNSCQAVTVPANCDVLNVSTEKCTQCKVDYFVNDQGTCTIVADNAKIQGCLIMATSTTCSRCSVGRALSLDKKVCRTDSDLDGNCNDGFVASTPVCSLCKAGNQFVGGKCVKNTNATIENGCLDEHSDKSCLVCISGYSMLEINKCTDNNPPTVAPKSSMIYSIYSLILMVMILQ